VFSNPFFVFSKAMGQEKCRFSMSRGSFSRFSEVPGGVQGRLWGVLGFPSGFLGSSCETDKNCQVFVSKLGPKLEPKNYIFGIKY